MITAGTDDTLADNRPTINAGMTLNRHAGHHEGTLLSIPEMM
jgi:hypothetical protein